MHVTITPERKAVGELDEQEGTLEELAELCTTYEVGEKDGLALIPARFRACADPCHGTGWKCAGGVAHRLSRNVAAMTALGVDLDDVPDETFARILDDLERRQLCVIVWHTHSHVPGCGKVRARLLFPFEVEMPLTSPRQWSSVAWKALVQFLGLPVGTDFSCRNPDRIYFLPRKPSVESAHAAVYQPGVCLDWRPIVGDAIAAAARELDAVAEVVAEDLSRPVDLDVIRAGLERITVSEPLRRVLRGEAPSPPPDRRKGDEPPRREAWRDVTVHLANVAEGWEDSATLLELYRPAHRAEVAASPDDHTAWDAVDALFAAARASAPSYKANKRAAERAWHEISRRRLQHTADALSVPGEARLRTPTQGWSLPAREVEVDELAAAPAPITPVARPLTDHGNALRFVEQHRDAVRFVPAWGKWVRWDGKRWRASEFAIDEAMATARSIYVEAGACADPEQAKKLSAWAHSSSMRRGLEAMPKLAGGMRAMQLEPDQLDADRMLFNCANGTLDLRTGELRPHAQDDLISKVSPVAYDSAATCPRWEQFLERILPSPAVRSFMQRAIGYALTGDVGEQVMFFMYGFGMNGKSTFLTTLQYIFGDYAKQADASLLLSTEHEQHTANKADLQGARLVVCSEVEQGRSFSEVTIKQLTGGDQVKARFLYGNFFEFTPAHKIFLAANHKPRVRGTDHAIWRRLRLVPFDQRITPEEKDTQLGEKLQAEAAGILAWAMRGCVEWQRAKLGEPSEVLAAVADYREDQDSLGHFIAETLEAGEGFLPSTAIYAAYVRWCERAGEKPWTLRSLSNTLIERGFQPGKTTVARGFKYVRMKPQNVAQQIAQAPVQVTVPGAKA